MAVSSVDFIIIAAHTNEMGIGKDNGLPWRGSAAGRADMKWFAATTTATLNSVVIMGRKTYESIPPKFRPLRDRINIVLTRSVDTVAFTNITEPIYAPSLDSAMAWCNEAHDEYNLGRIFVIGGAEVYAAALAHPLCREIYLSRIAGDWPCDVFFPHEQLAMFDEYEAGSIGAPDVDVSVYQYTNLDEDYYLSLLRELIECGRLTPNRTGVSAFTLGPRMLTFNLNDSRGAVLPLLTTKKIPLRWVYHELMWFLTGEPHTDYLKKNGITIWDANSSADFLKRRGLDDYREGEVGPAYGYQWRHFGLDYKPGERSPVGGIDQIQRLIESVRADPFSRRHIITAWNPKQVDQTALPPCHVMFQVIPRSADDEGIELDGVLIMRSTDCFLGLPWNIASYALLLHIIAKICGHTAGILTVMCNIPHLYETHVEAAQEQLQRQPRRFPTIELPPLETIDDIQNKYEQIKIGGYAPYPAIKAEMAV